MLSYGAFFTARAPAGQGRLFVGNSHVNLAVVMTYEVFLATAPGGENSNTRAAKVNRENPIGEHRKFPDQHTSEIDVDRIAAEGKYTSFVASRFRGRRSRHGAQLKVHLRFANGVD
jgi:hypothetical protein